VHHVARVDEAQAGAPGDGGDDPAVRELELDRVDVALIGPDGGRELGDAGGLRVELLLRDEAALDEGAVPLEIEARVAERGLVLRELALGLGELASKGRGSISARTSPALTSWPSWNSVRIS